MISKEFVLAGKATITIENDASWASQNGHPSHWTYKVSKKESNQGGDIYFVSLLTGHDNESSYSYLGILDKTTADVRLTAKSKVNDTATSYKVLKRVLNLVWKNETKGITDAGFEVHHSGRCGACGRKLTHPESIKTGFGPECGGRL